MTLNKRHDDYRLYRFLFSE